ncbi:UDP-glycosyltransferase UGT5-like [Nomia melanderi]|uniref:UDP-glycosyltransferase UGT5-like n=1 Tax=Nomia melanderi TaxID=2448451 RepID=UPI0013041AD7|nr:2-hydroxyacylsphingosine 1-beta-galactosyltransferase-like [Nomia melanderi]
MLRLTISVIIVAISSIAAGSRILGIAPYPAHSHQVIFRALTNELVRRGHEVVIFTAYPTNVNLTNYTEVDVSILTRKWKSKMDFYKVGQQEGILSFMHNVVEFGEEVSDTVLSHPVMQQIIDPRTTEKFDAILIQQLAYDALNAVSIRLNIPIIGVSSLDLIIPQQIHFGLNLLESSARSPVTGKRIDGLFDRIYQAYFTSRIAYMYYYQNLPIQEKVMRKHFGDTVPPIETVKNQIDILLLSVHQYFTDSRPTVPGIIHIGGCRFSNHTKNKRLPPDLQTELDNAKSGFIYMSMGSNVNVKQLPLHIRNMILSVFAELPYTVLWKSEIDLENKPDNVILRKWCPQEQVLAHPNIVLFIYQGGLQSTEEALEYAVPLLGMPVFADQFLNVWALNDHGVAEVLQFANIDKETFKQTILKVITNQSYKENIRKLSDLLHDLPQHPMDLAMWWIEHAIRHKGAKHIRSHFQDMEIYKIHHIDIFAVFVVFCILSLTITLLVPCVIYRSIKKFMKLYIVKSLKVE